MVVGCGQRGGKGNSKAFGRNEGKMALPGGKLKEEQIWGGVEANTLAAKKKY